MYYIKFKEKIVQSIQVNWIYIYESEFEMNITNGKKQRKNSFSYNRSVFIVMESGNLQALGPNVS